MSYYDNPNDTETIQEAKNANGKVYQTLLSLRRELRDTHTKLENEISTNARHRNKIIELEDNLKILRENSYPAAKDYFVKQVIAALEKL